MTEKRFYTDGQYVMQDKEVYVICNGEHNADVVATTLNELLDKNEELKELGDYFERKKYEYHNKWNLVHLDNINLRKENEKLKQELFESKKDYIIETYSNNPVRRDKKLQVLKEEFKERFGDLATYITSDELLFDIINETIEKGNSDN